MSIAVPVSEAMVIRRTRRLPIPGEVLVAVGQVVRADTVLAQAKIIGVEIPVEVCRKLGVPPKMLDRIMVKQVGDLATAGEEIAVNEVFFGLGRESIKAPCTSYVENICKRTGVVTMRTPTVSVQQKAYLPGRAVEVIEREGAIIESFGIVQNGEFGVGGERCGRLQLAVNAPDEVLTPERITDDMAGAIVVGGSCVPAATLRKAARTGVAAVIAGSVHDSDLADYLRYEVGVPITGQEDIVTALIITEGFGEIAMRPELFDLLGQHAGETISINGTTHLRSNLVKPEIVIPLTRAGE